MPKKDNLTSSSTFLPVRTEARLPEVPLNWNHFPFSVDRSNSEKSAMNILRDEMLIAQHTLQVKSAIHLTNTSLSDH